MPSQTTARDFRNLASYLRKTTNVLERASSINDIAFITGVGNRSPSGRYSSQGLTQRELKRIEKIKGLTTTQQASLIALNSFYGAIERELNTKYLTKPLSLDRIKRDSELRTGQRGKKTSSLSVEYTGGKRISYFRYPFGTEYRDPKKAHRLGSIHQGAATSFKRYALTYINVLGARRTAGKKGSNHQGLGFEPIGKKPKSSASLRDYRIFIRVRYPNRANPDKVTLKGPARHPVYSELLRNRRKSKPIYDTVAADSRAFADEVLNVLTLALNDLGNETRREITSR